jgi:hypothetical protein
MPEFGGLLGFHEEIPDASSDGLGISRLPGDFLGDGDEGLDGLEGEVERGGVSLGKSESEDKIVGAIGSSADVEDAPALVARLIEDLVDELDLFDLEGFVSEDLVAHGIS